jgi:hypothetical protein
MRYGIEGLIQEADQDIAFQEAMSEELFDDDFAEDVILTNYVIA